MRGNMLSRHEAVTCAYGIPGMMWPQELCWLYDTFSKSTSHLEIGSYCGRSLFASCVGMSPDAFTLSVDPISETDNTPSAEWVRIVRNATVSEIQRHTNVKCVEEKSIDALRDYERMFDSTFIDGSHHYADVSCDIQLALRLVKPGGIIAGHDYWPCHTGVMEAVNAFVPKFQAVPGTRIWVASL